MHENETQNLSKEAALEALLFHYGEPINVKNAAKLLNLKKEECEKIIYEYEKKLKENPERGLTLLKKEDKIQLVTKPELREIAQKLIEEEFKQELSPASLETLTIIAYLGPIPRSTIDYIRGVNSSFILRNLYLRGLVERNIEEGKGNLYYYQTSFDFLKHMGLTKQEELPEYQKYKNVLESFEIQTQQESI